MKKRRSLVDKKNRIVKLAETCSWQNLDDYCYIQNVRNGKLFFLKGLACELWNGIMSGKSLMCVSMNSITDEIAVSAEDKYQVVERFVEQMQEIGTIKNDA